MNVKRNISPERTNFSLFSFCMAKDGVKSDKGKDNNTKKFQIPEPRARMSVRIHQHFSAALDCNVRMPSMHNRIPDVLRRVEHAEREPRQEVPRGEKAGYGAKAAHAQRSERK